MSLTKDMWIAEHERIGEELWAGDISEEQARDRLKRLGLDQREIDGEIAAWKEEMDYDR
jgi:hypothetical protein